MRILLFVLAAAALATGVRQQAANTDVYLADIVNSDLLPHSAHVANISNNPGYDNQPSFTPDGNAVLFVSNRDGKQTDIYRYDLLPLEVDAFSLTSQRAPVAENPTQLTHTPESEYSPLVTPDGKGFSVIRVEADGAQRLWRFDLDGSNPRLVLENVKPVGYHVWIDDTHLALFVLGSGRGDPSTLQLADTKTGKAEVIDSNIGRSLLIRPEAKTVTYVSKKSVPWTVMELNPGSRASAPIAPHLEAPLTGSEDFAWYPATMPALLLVGQGSTIWSLNPSRSDLGWVKMLDLSSQGISRISRLTVNARRKNMIAFVAEPVAK